MQRECCIQIVFMARGGAASGQNALLAQAILYTVHRSGKADSNIDGLAAHVLMLCGPAGHGRSRSANTRR